MFYAAGFCGLSRSFVQLRFARAAIHEKERVHSCERRLQRRRLCKIANEYINAIAEQCSSLLRIAHENARPTAALD
jgi:hypothetical protein